MLSDNRTTLHDPSISSSWSSMLHNILIHPPYSLVSQASNRTRLRHCSGNIWKRLASVSIYHDLASISANQGTTTTRTTRRRFVRLEHIGLSGVILYEIRMCSPGRFFQGDYIDVEGCLTMQGAFGDPDSPEVAANRGMDLDDLLDAVDAKVVYFPTYACTSFIAGQVMNAYLTNRPKLTPIPALSGFSILCSEFSSSISIPLAPKIGQFSIDGPPIQPCPSGLHLDDLQETLLFTEDDPYLALCVRTSSLGSSVGLYNNASKYGDVEEEACEVGDFTIDSLGPCTPPRLTVGLHCNASGHSDPEEEVGEGEIGDCTIDSLGPCTPPHISYELFPSASKLNAGSEENESASFIDFTECFE